MNANQFQRFQILMIMNSLTPKQLREKTHISYYRYKKMIETNNYSIIEIQKISRLLNLSHNDIQDLFFNN